jgi:hypothetical protein
MHLKRIMGLVYVMSGVVLDACAIYLWFYSPDGEVYIMFLFPVPIILTFLAMYGVTLLFSKPQSSAQPYDYLGSDRSDETTGSLTTFFSLFSRINYRPLLYVIAAFGIIALFFLILSVLGDTGDFGVFSILFYGVAIFGMVMIIILIGSVIEIFSRDKEKQTATGSKFNIFAEPSTRINFQQSLLVFLLMVPFSIYLIFATVSEYQDALQMERSKVIQQKRELIREEQKVSILDFERQLGEMKRGDAFEYVQYLVNLFTNRIESRNEEDFSNLQIIYITKRKIEGELDNQLYRYVPITKEYNNEDDYFKSNRDRFTGINDPSFTARLYGLLSYKLLMQRLEQCLGEIEIIEVRYEIPKSLYFSSLNSFKKWIFLLADGKITDIYHYSSRDGNRPFVRVSNATSTEQHPLYVHKISTTASSTVLSICGLEYDDIYASFFVYGGRDFSLSPGWECSQNGDGAETCINDDFIPKRGYPEAIDLLEEIQRLDHI